MRNRIVNLLEEYGPLQVIDITIKLNDDNPDNLVTRNTVSTTIYNNLHVGGKLFKKVGYGTFDLVNNNSVDKTKEDVLKKLIRLMIGYQLKFKKMSINYDTKLFGISFTKSEIKYIQKHMEENRK